MKNWIPGRVTLACDALKAAVKGKKIALMMNTSALTNDGQLLLDVIPGGSKDGSLFVRPLKVWRRNSDTMFQPHVFRPSTGEFRALSEGVEVSRFYRRMNENAQTTQNQHMDRWDALVGATKHHS